MAGPDIREVLIEGAAGGFSVVADDLTLETAAVNGQVPEPGTFALTGAAAVLALVGLRRRGETAASR